MSTRRVPLANVPNAANSPYRAVAAAASKRARSQSTFQGELAYGQPPPAKRQAIELDDSGLQTPSRKQQIPQNAEGRVFNKRPANSQVTAFERKLLAAKDKQTQYKAGRQEKVVNENLDTIRQWQKHYRRVFPTYVFYFESVPDEVRIKYSKQVIALGAREEKFFSKEVTHIITTRSIPAESDTNTSPDTVAPSVTITASQGVGQLRTINPSLLERSSESTQVQTQGFLPKSKFTFEATAGRKQHFNGNQDGELRRQHAGNADILHRAREMGIKIWQLEKLQRMMTTMFDTDTSSQLQHGHNTRGNLAATAGTTKAGREGDLSQMLKNEQLNGPSDRDATVASKELIPFKGPYIFIHDMDEKARPVMVRDYPKVSRREDGQWPQFRSVSNGKCPFIEEVVHNRKEFEREKAREKEILARAKLENGAAPRTRAVAACESTKMQPPTQATRKRPLAEIENGANQMTRADEEMYDQACGPTMAIAAKRRSPAKIANQYPAAVGPRLHGGEPVASGVQPSNITSAIRSQMISSTAAAPGTKAGTSREVQGLQRKVLEKNSGPSIGSIPTSHRMTDLAGAARAENSISTARQAKRRAQEKLGYIHEDFTPSEEEENARKTEVLKRRNAAQKKIEKKDPKPGYCENCREKFDDFDDHTVSRKHRKFAVTMDHWKELDSLLSQLGRPLKEENSDEF